MTESTAAEDRGFQYDKGPGPFLQRENMEIFLSTVSISTVSISTVSISTVSRSTVSISTVSISTVSISTVSRAQLALRIYAG